MKRYWLPSSMLLYRELLRFWRDKARVMGFAGAPFMFWIVVGSGYSDLARFLPGALVLTVMFSAIFSSMSLIDDRREGFLRSVLASPAPRLSIVLGKVGGGALLAALQTFAFLAVATLGGTLYPDANYAAIVGLIFLIALSFTAAGFVIAWLVPSTQGFHAIINLLFVPLWMVSGAVFRYADASFWVQWLMLANPVTYAHQALAQFLGINTNSNVPVELSVSLVAVGLVALLFAAAKVIRRPAERNL